MATIKDVAKAAGVTVTTVSRVLNNRGYISEATRTKVSEAMEQLRYQPNELARSLYRRKTNLLGLIVPDVSHPFFGSLTNYIEYYANQAEYKIMICNSYQDSKKEKNYLDMLRRHKVDGIIMGSHSLETQEYRDTSLPIVAIDRNLSDNIPFITSDNYRGGMLATKLLISRGCKKIAHISGPLEIDTPANNRYRAFLDAVTEEKIDYVVKQTKLNEFDSDVGFAYELFEEMPDIDGVFASSDLIAATILKAAYYLKKEVPGDLKIVGYDDIRFAQMMVPSLTTIRQPIEDMGKRAVRVLIDQIEGKNVPVENILPIELIERETT